MKFINEASNINDLVEITLYHIDMAGPRARRELALARGDHEALLVLHEEKRRVFIEYADTYRS